MSIYVIQRLLTKYKIIHLNHAYSKRTAVYLVQRNAISMSVSQINEEKQSFQDAWQNIIYAIKTNHNFSQLPEVRDWVLKIFDYNTSDNHKMRGLAAVLSYKMLEKPENITEAKLKLIRIAAWLIEALQAHILMLDDIVDGSTTRRGKPCWYRNPDVGLSAVHDCSIMNNIVFDIFKKYFGDTKYYPTISNLMNEYILCIFMGMHIENKTVYKKRSDLNLFTKERYETIVKYKASICGTKLPIFLAMFFIEDKDKLPKKEIENICFELGSLLQLQNDVLDCYGNPAISGKVGTDIQEGKCSWLAVQALQRCSQSQRTVFENNFGKQEPEHVERIKLLYDELNLLDVFKHEENNIYKRILQQMRALPERVSPSIFHQYIDFYKQKSLALKSEYFFVAKM